MDAIFSAAEKIRISNQWERREQPPIDDSAQVGNENNSIKNTIADAFAARNIEYIKAKTPFHVYLVAPVHPEGDPSNPSIWKQHYFRRGLFA